MNGVNNVIHYLATEQHKSGCDVEVWGVTATPHIVHHQHEYQLRLFNKALFPFFLAKDLRKTIYEVPFYEVPFRFFLAKDLRKAIYELPSDTVAHLHSVFIPEFYVVSRHLKKREIPWVVTPHGGYSPGVLKKNRFAKTIYIALFESLVVHEAKLVHVIGENEVNDVKKFFRPKSIVLIPNGQDLNELAFSRKKLDRPNRPVFGFCGRLAKPKGLDLLIEGFSLYKNGGGSGELWLIGDGQDRETLLAQAARLGISDEILFLGSMFGEEKLNRLAHLDVFIHTSRRDGLPTAVLEAAGLSKPLLISKATNLAGYVDRWRCGLVLEKNAPTNIADALSVMAAKYQTGELRLLGENANAMIRRDFQWPSIASRLLREAYLGDC